MKLLPLASLTIVASLSLTGCASSPSLEDQAKLIEYEKCLEQVTARLYSVNYTTNSGYGDNYTYSENSFQNNTFKLSLEECAEYRP